jgi:thiol-disulfide isomerase/thioredoxin
MYGPVLAALAGTGILIGVTVGSNDPHGTPGYHRGADGALVIDAAHRPTAPDLTGTGIDGRPTSIAAYKGRTVVVNVWASWCGPCRKETSALTRYEEKAKGQGVAVLGLNEDDSSAAAHSFAHDFHMAYPSILDSAGDRFRALARGLTTTQGLPVTFVVDRHGRVAAAMAGGIDEDRLAALVDATRTDAGSSQPKSPRG